MRVVKQDSPADPDDRAYVISYFGVDVDVRGVNLETSMRTIKSFRRIGDN